MGSSAASRLTPLQRDLLAAFFEREPRFFLTGGGALAGFYFGHRTIDLVIDRAPMVDPEKVWFGGVRVDTLREIAANKICTLLSRSELKDLVDLQALIGAGIDLRQAFADAELKEAGAEPATLAWLLEELRIAPDAPVPGDVDVAALESFRQAFVKQLRALAFARARRGPA